MKNRLTKNQLEKLVREQLTDEIRQQIDESIWSSIKYGVGKLGSLEAGTGVGKYLNPKAAKRREVAKDKLEASLEKESKKKVKELVASLKKEYETMEEFPNMEDQYEFQAILAHFLAFYESLKAATEKFDYSKGPEEQPEGAMHADVANELVQAMQEYLVFQLDNNLADGFKHANENLESEEGQSLEEMLQEVDWAKKAAEIEGEEGGEAEGEEDFTKKKSMTMEGLQAKTLENTLIALGGVFVAAHFVAMQTVTETMEVVAPAQGGQTVTGGYSDVIEQTHTKVVENAANSVSGQGTGGLQTAVARAAENSGAAGAAPPAELMENMRAMANHSNSSMEEVVSAVGGTLKHPLGERTLAVIADLDAEGVAVGEIVRSGKVSEDILTRITELDGEVGAAMRELGAGAAQGGGTASPLNSLLDISHDKFTIAGKMVTEQVVPVGAQMFKMYTLKGAATTATVAVAATFPALGGILLPIGVAFATMGLSIKLLRAKGRKDSRAADLAAARDYIKLFKPGVPVLDPKPEQGEEEGPGAGVYEEGSACAQLVQPLRDLDLKVGDTFTYTTADGVEKTAMVLATEGMPAITGWSTGGLKTSRTIDYEEQCQQENGRFVQGPNMITFNEGPGTRLEEILSEEGIDEAQSAKLNNAIRGVNRDYNKWKSTPQRFLKKYGIKRKPKMAYKFAKELSKEEQKQLIDYTKKIRSKVTKASTEKAIGRELKPELIKVANVPENVGQSYLSNIIDPDGARVRKGKSDEGISPNAKLPEGFKAELNIRDINRGDDNFEAFLKSYTDQLVNSDVKEERVKRWTDVMVPELRKRRGMSGEEPAVDEPAAAEPTADEPRSKDQAGKPSTSPAGKSALAGGTSLDDLLGVGSTGIKNQKGGSKKKVRPPTDAGTMRRRKKTRGGRALEETTEINETLARWKKIAGIIKESKDD